MAMNWEVVALIGESACLLIIFILCIRLFIEQAEQIKKACKKAEIDAYFKYSYEEFEKLFLNAEVNALANGDESTVKELIAKKQKVNEIYEYLKKETNV